MKTSHNLEQFNIGGAGCRDEHSERYLVDGKRVTREAFDAIKRDPSRRLECLSNSNQGGVMHFYSVSRLAEVSP